MKMVTEEVAEAVKGAGLVIVTTPAFGHQVFLRS